MSGLFAIPIGGLKEGRYNYDFDITSSFFGDFEESEVHEGELKVMVEIEKRSSLMELNIRINGVVNISCDRCLDVFRHPLNCENRLLVKFGKTHDDSDPDIITIPPDEHELDLKQYFYEYILLAMPIQRVHPPGKDGKSTCDPIMIEKLKAHIVTEEPEPDPRWDELKKLISNN
jgi:uncharacterized metal-binding protein YceD (DUF177 family)